MDIPRIHFAHLPTRIEELPRLTEYLSGPRILVKRDVKRGLPSGAIRLASWNFLLQKHWSREQRC